LYSRKEARGLRLPRLYRSTHVLGRSQLDVDSAELPPSLPPFLPPHQNALPERKWLAFMGLSVALYLNPVMVVGNFVSPGSARWGLASEASLSVAVAIFLVVALCIADGVGKDRVAGAGWSVGFYAPKVGVVFLI